MQNSDFEVELSGPADDHLLAFVPIGGALIRRPITSAEALNLALDILLGNGASDHVRRRWSDTDYSKARLVWHPFKTEGKWIEDFPIERDEMLRKGAKYVARHFRYACIDGHVSSYVRGAVSREWFRVTCSYWSSHRSAGDAFPARLCVDEGVGSDDILSRSLIVFAHEEVTEWAKSQFGVLAKALVAGGTLPPDEDVEEIDVGMVSDRTGGPGRPTSKHFLLRILRARSDKGLLCTTLKAEAAAVNAEFNADAKFEGLARMEDPAAENAIRELYRQLKAEQAAH